MNRVKGRPLDLLPWHRRAWQALNPFWKGLTKDTLPCAVNEEIMAIPSAIPEILRSIEMMLRVMNDDPSYSGFKGRENLEKYYAKLRDSQAQSSRLDKSTCEAFAASLYELLDRDPKLKSTYFLASRRQFKDSLVE
jgi:hypothetical protein